jgi:hypothetical protein
MFLCLIFSYPSYHFLFFSPEGFCCKLVTPFAAYLLVILHAFREQSLAFLELKRYPVTIKYFEGTVKLSNVLSPGPLLLYPPKTKLFR